MIKSNTGDTGTAIIREDRRSIDLFLAQYSRSLEQEIKSVAYPEDLNTTPADARIDAIYSFDTFDLHIEHSSIDLIVSGNKNKRSLDPAFLALESELKKIVCPIGQGLSVGLRLEYAKNIPALKKIAQSLKDEIESYISRTPLEEWRKYPRISDKLTVGAFEFDIRPDVFRRSEVDMYWLGSDANYVTPDKLEAELVKLLPTKLPKLNRSISLSKRPAYSLLLIENTDVAAQSFHAFCGPFARVMNSSSNPCSEVWGYRPNTDATLVWHHEIDEGRTDCAYTEDSQYRTWAEIENHRSNEWRLLRKRWIADSIKSRDHESKSPILENVNENRGIE